MERVPFPVIVIVAWSFLMGVFAAAFAAPPVATDALERVLSCSVDARLPQPPEIADEGGYRLEYQSLGGHADDGRACAVYRLRNSPGKPPTPFRWRIGEEPIVEGAHVDRCPREVADCPWLAIARYFPGEVAQQLSELSYGLNADAFHETAETLMTRSAPDPSQETQSVGTEFAGRFVAADGRAFDLHFVVKSRVAVDPDLGRVAVLELTDFLPEGALARGELRLAWSALQGLPEVAPLAADDRSPFVLEPGAVPSEVAGGAPGSGVRIEHAADAGSAIARLVFPLDRYELRRDFRLEVRVAASGALLAEVPMPAFVPAGAP